MLNAIGLENPGVERFCERLLPESRGLGVPLVASVAGNSPSDYAECARVIEEAGGVVAVEVNLSCPNDRDAAARRTPLAFGQDPRAAAEVVGAVVASCALPVWAKLTSSVADIASVARGCVEAGADAVVAVNTIPAMAIDLRARRPVLSAVTGGLSGPAIRPVALRCAWEVSRAVGCAVVACGGIESAEDALAAVLAGASAVEVGTATFRDPRAAERIVGELPSLLEEVTREGERCSVRSLVGRLEC
jgi:dihydroorotate dehydrogenase (NAD+) catalytic subunit